MITGFLFDLYETLVTERAAFPVRAGALGPRFGLDQDAYRKAWKPQRRRIIRGEIAFAEALLEVGAALGRRLDSGLVHRLNRPVTQCRKPLPTAYGRKACSTTAGRCVSL